MRKRFNTRAVCSSDNYQESKKAHLAMLNVKHSNFNFIAVSDTTSVEPTAKLVTFKPKYKTIKVFGKKIRVTTEEYNNYCKEY